MRAAVRTNIVCCASLYVLAVSCSDSAPSTPKGMCPVDVLYKPKSGSGAAYVVGDFNQWTRPGVPLEASDKPEYRKARVFAAPGELRYAIAEGGAFVLDESVGTTSFYLGSEVSFRDVPDCRRASGRIQDARVALGKGTIQVTWTPGEGGARVDPSTIRVRVDEGTGQSVQIAPLQNGRDQTITVLNLAPGKTRLTLTANDTNGLATADLRATLWRDAEPFDPRDAIVYQVVTDRFEAASGALKAPASPSARAGGTFKGLENAVVRGDLDELGVNVVWISPVYQNPDGEFPGTDGHTYSSYHGYWPKDPRAIDARFGSPDDLRSLVRTLHARGMRIVFDVVPNHVHQEHPYAKRAGWVQGAPGQCTCGTPSCSWGQHIDDCWFAPYMPDLDWKNPQLAQQMTDDVDALVSEYGIDGIRIDAVPMMPRAATRRLAARLRAKYEHPGAKMWLVGENFTGPATPPEQASRDSEAQGTFGLLRSYLGPAGLDTEFNFPIMWALRSAIAEGTSGLADVDRMVQASEAAFQGTGAVMGLMIGNHDVSRFSSVIIGDGNGDGFVPAKWPVERASYQKQALALSIVLTLPGAPFVYYGDEIALPGHPDPDSRRVMPARSAWSPLSLEVRESVSFMGKLRKCSVDLRRGRYRSLYSDRERWVFAREGDVQTALVVVTREPAVTGDLEVPLSGVREGTYVDARTHEKLDVRQSSTRLPGGALGVRVYLPAEHPCLSP